MLIGGYPGINLVATYPNCDAVEQHITLHQPNVIIMDIDMPGKGGIIGVQQAKNSNPLVNILMFTVFEDEEKIFACLQAGANGYLLKKTPPSQLIEAIFDVQAGGAPMTPEIARKVLKSFQEKKVAPPEFTLSPREMEILACLSKGNTYKYMAYELNISIETVRTHLKHIYDKMHVNCGTEAVAKALRMRLLE
jgi:DNA-binding NarL/FixJ family response regulator